MTKVQERLRRILDDVLQERERQDAGWGEQNHADPTWALILGEEFGEAQKAVLELDYFLQLIRARTRSSSPTTPDRIRNMEKRIRNELIQTAAVAIAWLECIERRKAPDEKGGSGHAESGLSLPDLLDKLEKEAVVPT